MDIEKREIEDAEWIAERARIIGTEHGRIAAGWWEQNAIGGRATRVDRLAVQRIIDGIEDGDPEILDSIPHANLSGEWADGYSSQDLQDELGYSSDDCWECDEYELAFNDAVESEVSRLCREYLAD
jgi:hypothetical protein